MRWIYYLNIFPLLLISLTHKYPLVLSKVYFITLFFNVPITSLSVEIVYLSNPGIYLIIYSYSVSYSLDSVYKVDDSDILFIIVKKEIIIYSYQILYD